MANTYFKIEKTVETKGFSNYEDYTNDYELTLTAFVGGENNVQLTVRCNSTKSMMNGIAHVVLSDADIDNLIAGLLERKNGEITATGCEQSKFCPNED